MDFILTIIVTMSAGLSFFYSMRTRTYRKQQHFSWMKFYNAKTNIAMGIMLIALAIIQFTFVQLTGLRIGVGIVFLILGLINFFVGLKNYKLYRAEI